MSEAIEITIKYSCDACGLRDTELSVPGREGEDIMEWMEKTVGQHIRKDHYVKSPSCDAESVQNLMIPITGAQKVGGPAIN